VGDDEDNTYHCCKMSAERSGCYVEINATTNVRYRGFNFVLHLLFVFLCSKSSLFQAVVFYFFPYFIRVKVADSCKYSTFSAGRSFLFFYEYYCNEQMNNEKDGKMARMAEIRNGTESLV